MKSLSPVLQAHLDEGATTLAWCWRLARPNPNTVAAVPQDWANWIADLDDRMTGTCR